MPGIIFKPFDKISFVPIDPSANFNDDIFVFLGMGFSDVLFNGIDEFPFIREFLLVQGP